MHTYMWVSLCNFYLWAFAYKGKPYAWMCGATALPQNSACIVSPYDCIIPERMRLPVAISRDTANLLQLSRRGLWFTTLKDLCRDIWMNMTRATRIRIPLEHVRHGFASAQSALMFPTHNPVERGLLGGQACGQPKRRELRCSSYMAAMASCLNAWLHTATLSSAPFNVNLKGSST